MQKVQISIANEKLQGNIFIPPKTDTKAPGVLFIHGWQSAQDRYFGLAQKLSELGFMSLTFDLRGHGKSPGDLAMLSRKDFLDDVVSAYDFLTQSKSADSKNISVVGSSFGAYLGAILSPERKVAQMVLRVPADYPDGGFKEPELRTPEQPRVAEWRATPRDFNLTKSLRAVRNFGGRILIIESEKDELVPHQTVVNYANAVLDKSKLTYVVMKGAPHSLRGHKNFQKEFEQILSRWFLRT